MSSLKGLVSLGSVKPIQFSVYIRSDPPRLQFSLATVSLPFEATISKHLQLRIPPPTYFVCSAKKFFSNARSRITLFSWDKQSFKIINAENCALASVTLPRVNWHIFNWSSGRICFRIALISSFKQTFKKKFVSNHRAHFSHLLDWILTISKNKSTQFFLAVKWVLNFYGSTPTFRRQCWNNSIRICLSQIKMTIAFRYTVLEF